MKKVCLESLVSIIMPSHNSEKFISKSIQSVISQNYQNWELLVTDDYSTDSTKDIVRAISVVEPRVKLLINNGLKGVAYARNNSIYKAEGEFIAFLDSDDTWLPEYLELRIFDMTKNNFDFTYCYYDKVNSFGQYLSSVQTKKLKVSCRQLLYGNVIGCLTAIYNCKSIGKIYMPIMKKRQDFGLWIRILSRIDYAYCYPRTLAHYCVQNNSISSNKFTLLRYNWAIYREVAKLSFVASCYFMCIFLVRYVLCRVESLIKEKVLL